MMAIIVPNRYTVFVRELPKVGGKGHAHEMHVWPTGRPFSPAKGLKVARVSTLSPVILWFSV